MRKAKDVRTVRFLCEWEYVHRSLSIQYIFAAVAGIKEKDHGTTF